RFDPIQPRPSSRRDSGSAKVLPEAIPSSNQPSNQGPIGPILRANPFPKVTDLFCRLPLPTLFYQLEAVHLGDLLRLCVRPGTKINLSLGFSRVIENAPDHDTSVELFRPKYHISGQSEIPWSLGPLKRKDNSSRGFR